MGLSIPAIKAVLHEHRFRPILGSIAHFGKQTVYADDFVLAKLFGEYGVDTIGLNIASEQDRDRQTRASNGNVHDHQFMRALGECRYHCVDVSDYEGADTIHDMNTPIPNEYHSKFDYLYDGSCIDNVFDPITFVRNVSSMLKPGGRAILVNHASAYPGAYLAPSAEWFYSYFAANGFADCKVYVGKAVPGVSRFFVEYDLYSWQPYFTRRTNYDYFAACADIETWLITIVVAEKGELSTANKTPIQSHYLTKDDIDWRECSAEFNANPRPLMSGPKFGGVRDDLMGSDHYRYLGRL